MAGIPGGTSCSLRGHIVGQLALAEVRLAPHLAGERHLHLEQPHRVPPAKLGNAGVPERHVRAAGAGVEVVHPRRPQRGRTAARQSCSRPPAA